MINVTVAACKARIENEEHDLRALWITQFACVLLAALFVVFGPAIMALFPIGLSAIMFFPMIDMYRSWKERLAQLLEATRNVPVDIDF